MSGTAARGRRGQGVLAMLAFGGAAMLAVAVAGGSRVPDQDRVAQITSVQLTDDDGNHALFAANALAPGRSVTRCLHVDYTGSAGAGPVRLVATDVAGALATHLGVRVSVGTGGGFAGCTGFSGAVMYSGNLAGLAGGPPTAPGVTTGWTPDPGSGRTFQIVVTVDASAAQGQAATGTFQWVFLDDVPAPEADPAPAPPPPAPAEVPPPQPDATPDPPATTKPDVVVPPAPGPSTDPGVPAPVAPPSGRAPTAPKHAAPAHAAPAKEHKKTGIAAVVPSPQQVAEDVKKLIDNSVVVGTRMVKHGGLPVGWLVAIAFFLVVQNRIDRRDPKLALAPVWRESDVAFPDVVWSDGVSFDPISADAEKRPEGTGERDR